MTLEGFDRLRKVLAVAPDVVKRHSADAVGFSALEVAQRVRALVPVDTGLLKRNIGVDHGKDRLTAGVGIISESEAYYWRFIEFGTVKQEARPFFRPAAEASSAFFLRQMQDVGDAVEHDLSEGRF